MRTKKVLYHWALAVQAFPGTNTLAYSAGAYEEKKKSFIKLATDCLRPHDVDRSHAAGRVGKVAHGGQLKLQVTML